MPPRSNAGVSPTDRPPPWRRALALAVFAAAAGTAAPALALDLPTLDRVSVMMSIDQVRAMTGPPNDMRQIAPDLTLAMWRMDGVPGMLAAGGIFDWRQALIAQAYVFAGSLGEHVFDRMRDIGFKATTGADGVTRLYGPDDGTGAPLVAIVDMRGDTTTVFAYEQREYERRSAAGTMPAPGAAGTAPQIAVPAQPGAGGMDDASRSALMSGIGILGGQLRPIQKSTTLSSSSSTTRNADGSVTTRSRSTSASVSVDPAGVANALMQLFK